MPAESMERPFPMNKIIRKCDLCDNVATIWIEVYVENGEGGSCLRDILCCDHCRKLYENDASYSVVNKDSADALSEWLARFS